MKLSPFDPADYLFGDEDDEAFLACAREDSTPDQVAIAEECVARAKLRRAKESAT